MDVMSSPPFVVVKSTFSIVLAVLAGFGVN